MNRLVYAVLGLVAGSALGLLLAWLWGLVLATRVRDPVLQPDFTLWIAWSAGLCALLGFLFKGQVGAALGHVFASVLHTESGRGAGAHLSGWQFVVVVCALGGGAWYLLR